jgi:transposase
MVIEALRDQFQLITQLTERVESIEHKLDWFRRSDERCQRLLEIPGVGLLTATAVVASVGDATEKA